MKAKTNLLTWKYLPPNLSKEEFIQLKLSKIIYDISEKPNAWKKIPKRLRDDEIVLA